MKVLRSWICDTHCHPYCLRRHYSLRRHWTLVLALCWRLGQRTSARKRRAGRLRRTPCRPGRRRHRHANECLSCHRVWTNSDRSKIRRAGRGV